jgi:TP901 family phage tail tape measure protein
LAEGSNIEINLQGDIFERLKALEGQMKGFQESVKSTGDSLKLLALNAASTALQNLGAPFVNGAKEVYSFDHSLRELSAITGVTGKGLDQMGDFARDAAKEFGGKGADYLKTYGLMLSELSPKLADKPEALKEMGRYASLLGKTMGGDTTAATTALNAAMNQFGVDLSDPMKAADEMRKMMNQMGAAAQAGSVAVPQVAQALNQVGAKAKAAGLNFTETNAALQVLGKYGKKGAEGGVALRNVLTLMSRDDFMPKEVAERMKSYGVNLELLSDPSVSLKDRLTELKKIGNDGTLLSGLFGANEIAARGLMENTDLLEEFMGAIDNNATATEDMAATIGESYDEVRARIVANFDDIKLSIFQATGGMLPYMELTVQGMMGIAQVAPGIMATAKAVKMLAAHQKVQAMWTGIQTALQWKLNIAGYAFPVFWMVAGIAALIAVVVMVVKKYEEWGAALTLVLGPLGMIINIIMSFKRHWDSIVDAFKNDGIVAGLKRIGLVMLDALLMPVQQLLELVAKVTGWDWVEGAKEKIKGLRQSLELTTEEKKEETKQDAAEVAGGDMFAASMIPDPKATDKAAKETSGSGGVTGDKSAAKSIVVSIDKLVGTINFTQVADIPGIKNKLRDAINEALIGGVRDFETAAG